MVSCSLTRRLQLALGMLAAAAAAGASAQVILYEHGDYGGRAYTAFSQQANLSRNDFSDRASSVVVRGGNWQLCNDADFRGQCITLNPGRYPQLGEMGMNDRVTSVRPISDSGGNSSWGGGWGGSNAAVEMFENSDYGGRSLKTSGSANLSRDGFNDKASSLIIRSGRWDFCTDADYDGRCVTLGPGSYGRLSEMDLNDGISSLRPSGGYPAYGGRNSNSSWSGDDGSPPQVSLQGNGSGRVTYNNGCVVYYNAAGQRFQNLPACHGQQIPRADSAMASRRNEQGMNRSNDEHPWAAQNHRHDDSAPPEIIMGTNREGEVIFSNCVAYYNAQGRRYRQQPSCSGSQLQRADVAMAAHRREQGI